MSSNLNLPSLPFHHHLGLSVVVPLKPKLIVVAFAETTQDTARTGAVPEVGCRVSLPGNTLLPQSLAWQPGCGLDPSKQLDFGTPPPPLVPASLSARAPPRHPKVALAPRKSSPVVAAVQAGRQQGRVLGKAPAASPLLPPAVGARAMREQHEGRRPGLHPRSGSGLAFG